MQNHWDTSKVIRVPIETSSLQDYSKSLQNNTTSIDVLVRTSLLIFRFNHLDGLDHQVPIKTKLAHDYFKSFRTTTSCRIYLVWGTVVCHIMFIVGCVKVHNNILICYCFTNSIKCALMKLPQTKHKYSCWLWMFAFICDCTTCKKHCLLFKRQYIRSQ